MIEIDSWLGPAAGDLSDEEKQRLSDVFDSIAVRWPDPDDSDDCEAAMSGAAQIVFGDNTLTGLTQQWQQRRSAEREAMRALSEAIAASEDSDREINRQTGLHRETIRRARARAVVSPTAFPDGVDTGMLRRLSEQWFRLRIAEREAMSTVTGAIMASDSSEREISRQTGLNRLTVRRALGKQ